MTGFAVLDASTPEGTAEWMSLWRTWPDREVMAHPEYVRLFLERGDRAIAVTQRTRSGAILFPLIVRPIASEGWARPGEQRFDATSPYGYGGPFVWGDARPATDAFWREYAHWAARARLVTTFARLSLFPEQLASTPGLVEERSLNVVRTLDRPLDDVWHDYAPKVRKNVRTAERAGLRVEIDPSGARLDAFLSVYGETMRRRAASQRYDFPRAFFEDLLQRLRSFTVFFHVVSGSRVVSSELVLVSARHLYSFLGGTSEDAFPLRPNDLLKHAVVAWGIEQGKQSYVLGGGQAAMDGIFKYKLAFAPAGQVPFRVARIEHDREAVHELVQHRQEHAGRVRLPWSPRPQYFPSYRA